MRNITHIVVHCSASKAKADVGVNEIRRWHQDKGWSNIGYHFVIRRNGLVEEGRPLEQPGAHVLGWNANSIGICLAGGIDDKGKPEFNFEDEQMASLRELIDSLRIAYPTADVLGHRDFPHVKKACPCFDVREWMRSGQII